jgi:hypothetical protein
MRYMPRAYTARWLGRSPLFADDFAAQATSDDRRRGVRDGGYNVLLGCDPVVLRAGPVQV